MAVQDSIIGDIIEDPRLEVNTNGLLELLNEAYSKMGDMETGFNAAQATLAVQAKYITQVTQEHEVTKAQLVDARAEIGALNADHVKALVAAKLAQKHKLTQVRAIQKELRPPGSPYRFRSRMGH
jgi:hypothetical protein